jgi:hypothetical protein
MTDLRLGSAIRDHGSWPGDTILEPTRQHCRVDLHYVSSDRGPQCLACEILWRD